MCNQWAMWGHKNRLVQQKYLIIPLEWAFDCNTMYIIIIHLYYYSHKNKLVQQQYLIVPL